MELNNNLYGITGGIKCGKDTVGEMVNYFASVTNPTFEDFLEKNPYHLRYEVRKFADKLKECVALIIGCTRADLEDQDFKAKPLGPQWWYYKFNNRMINYNEYKRLNKTQQEYFELIKLTPRLILQLLGTEGGRKIIHPDIWVNALFADFKHDNEWIITDLRFPENEGQAIRDRHGIIIGVKRHFALRFPDYAHLAYDHDPYMIPDELEDVDPKLYEGLNHASETAMGDLQWCDVVIENNGTIEQLFDRVLGIVSIQQGIV